ncbi:N6-L-threonylcarbamoyladenine synthase [Spironucleus salmonicida]|uniref:N(6)-L-threonylcarbamoyladenine synthase n=1 Tax=Spironucleus salmonicida TaxID=348837 RepID=A0A9P8RVH6_9EUKA|nr:N6-L-threonylcarbamoyladenine synthase [Spironucleus salmonicida]
MPIYTLGLEGSANKLGVAVLCDDIILSNVRHTFVAPTGSGFRPPEVTQHHRSHILALLREALHIAHVRMTEINIIAYTRGPGLGGPLAAVLLVAKTLAVRFGIPIQAVNHCVAHAEMGRHVLGVNRAVVLYASGGNTQVLGLENGRYRIFGEAIDVAVGNCLDRVARDLGISNDPAPGLNIELLARKFAHKQHILDVPIPIKGMDVSCSGINSYMRTHFEKLSMAWPEFITSQEELVQYFCYSLQENLFAALVEITERVCAHLRSQNVLCVGGVGCNERLQEMLAIMCQERGGSIGGMDERYCIDNGAMIGLVGYLQETNGVGRVDVAAADVVQRWRTDSVEIKW